MNVLIILSFLVFIASIVVLLFPKQCILMMGYINRYDIDSIPLKYTRRLFIITTMIMTASLIVLYFEVGSMNYSDLNINWEWFTNIFG